MNFLFPALQILLEMSYIPSHVFHTHVLLCTLAAYVKNWIVSSPKSVTGRKAGPDEVERYS
jgi:hypothetical protein